MPLSLPSDIHTHDISRRANAIVSGSPAQVSGWITLYPECHFSVGIHPWNTTDFEGNPTAEATALQHLATVAEMPQVAAIGEAGLDGLHGGSPELQMRILRAHITLSEHLQKPLVLHIVKRYNEIIALRRELLPEITQPWIFHGFRGKPQLARQLLATSTERHPVCISLGEHFNPLTAATVPLANLRAETDESQLSIDEIEQRIEAARARGGQTI